MSGGCGNGHVIFAAVVDHTLEWRNYTVTLGEEVILTQSLRHPVGHSAKSQLLETSNVTVFLLRTS